MGAVDVVKAVVGVVPDQHSAALGGDVGYVDGGVLICYQAFELQHPQTGEDVAADADLAHPAAVEIVCAVGLFPPAQGRTEAATGRSVEEVRIAGNAPVYSTPLNAQSVRIILAVSN